MIWVNIGLFSFTMAAVWLSQTRSLAWRRWSPVVGILAQPFWYVVAFQAGQWALVAITTFYFGCYVYGFWNLWRRA